MKNIFFLLLILGSNTYAQKYNFSLDTTQIKYDRSLEDSARLSINYSVNGTGSFIKDSTLVYEDFYDNGQKKSFYTLLNNQHLNGPSISWYANGKMMHIINYIYGLPFGGSMSWHENGKTKEKGNYWLDINIVDTIKSDTILLNSKKRIHSVKDRKITFEGRISTSIGPYKDGTWTYYDTNEKLVKTEYWRKGKLLKTVN